MHFPELPAEGGPACQGREALGRPYQDPPGPPSGTAVARDWVYACSRHPWMLPRSTYLGDNHLVCFLEYCCNLINVWYNTCLNMNC